jgi:hypothetical protein
MTFDYGNVLTRTLQITWKHKSFWLFMMFPMLIASGMFIAFAAPVFLLGEDDETMGLVFVIWTAVLTLGTIVIFIVSAAGTTSLTLGILRAERGEGSTSFMDLVRDGFQYFGRAVGVILIVQLSVGLVFTVFFLCIAALFAVTMGVAAICLQPIVILISPLSFLIVAVITGALAAVIDESLGAWDAVKRALKVVRDHVWKFILISFIIYFGVSILSGVIALPAMIPAMAAPIMMEAGIDMGEQMVLPLMILFACLFFPLMSLLTGITGTLTTSALGLAYLRLSHPAGSSVVFAPDEPKDATS